MYKLTIRLLVFGSLIALAAAANLFQSTVVGSAPEQIIGGVQSGGAPWVVVTKGEAKLDNAGRLEVEVEGLVLASGPFQGSPGPITHVAASLVCGGSGGAVVATTGPFPLSSTGDARIDENITLPPSPCFGPVVLVRVAGTTTAGILPAPGRWIAANGF